MRSGYTRLDSPALTNRPLDKTSTRDLVRKTAMDMGIDPDLAEAMLQQESGGGANNYRFEPKINDASFGPLQILSGTARGLGYEGPPEGLFDPAVSVPYAMKYFKNQMSQFGDPRKALAAYNAGPGNIGAGMKYADEVLGRMSGPANMGAGMPMDMGALIPNLGGIMNWIRQSDTPGVDWSALGNDAMAAESDALANVHRAEGGLGTEAIEQQFRETAPPAGGDFIERLFGNLASSLTGNPLFAQAAIGGQAQRDQGRRQEILRKNIASYERAANSYEKAGQYSQAVKMRKMEFAERKRESEMAAKAGLAETGLKAFAQIKETMIRAGVQIKEDGSMSVIKPIDANPGKLMKREDWMRSMVDLTEAMNTAAGLKNKNLDKWPEVQKNLRNQMNGHAATPVEGMTADQLALQIQQYAFPGTSAEEMGQMLTTAIRANPDMPGAKALLQAAPAAAPPPRAGGAPTEEVPPQTAALSGKKTPSRQSMIPAHKSTAGMKAPDDVMDAIGGSTAGIPGLFASGYLDAVRATLHGFGVSSEKSDEALQEFSMRMRALSMAETLKVADKMKQRQEKERKEAAKAK
jgi:transglycosylase-like protein with SLT domain